MQYLAAYTLASLSGKEPTENDIKNILTATGKEFDAAQVCAVIDSLKGKPLHELISSGHSKVGAVGGAPAATKTETAKNDKKDNKPAAKPEPVPVPAAEEQEEDFNLDLFG